MPVTLVLASASPARRAVLAAAGVDARVAVSGVDEDAVAAALPSDATPEQVVTALAVAKARDVAATLAGTATLAGEAAGPVIIGCDSMLLINGRLRGKPHTPAAARAAWREQAGATATLLTGHALIRGDRLVTGIGSTKIRFAKASDTDIDAYIASGEPLEVAGAFTLDGRGGWLVDAITGDPSNVIGISLPLTRRLLAELGVSLASLWGH